MPQRKKMSVILPEDLLKKLDDYGGNQPIIPSRSKAVAKLLNRALKVGFHENEN